MRYGPEGRVLALGRPLGPAGIGFDHVPRVDVDRARLVPVRRWLPGTAATTFGRWIVVRAGRVEDRALLAHELVHVRQWREWGACPFLARYLLDYGRARVRGWPHRRAYRAIRFEVEARRDAALDVAGGHW